MVSLIGPSVFDQWTGPVPSKLHAHLPADDVLVVRTETGLDLIGLPSLDRFGVRRLDRRRLDGVGPEVFDAFRIERGDPAPAGRHRRQDDPARSRARARRGVVHQGLLPRPGARVPHRQPRAREPVPPSVPQRSRATGPWPARKWSSATRSSARSRASPRLTLPTGALGYVRREVEPPATVDLRSGRRARNRDGASAQSSRPARLNTWPVVPSVGRVAR